MGGIGRPRRDFAGQQSELAELVDELHASREQISTLAMMWSSVTSELRAAEAVLIKMKSQPQVERSCSISPVLRAARPPKELLASTYLSADFMSFQPT